MKYILKGEEVGFTEPKEEYVKLYKDWFNDLEVNQFTSSLGAVFTKEEEEDWYQAQAEADEPTFTIHHLLDDKPIGNCGLHNINHDHDHAEMGIVLGEKDYWNRGFGTEAVRLLTDYGFTALSLHGISLWVKGYNQRAIRVYEKVGYQESGRMRDFYKVDGEYYDQVLMDVLREEFYKINQHSIRNQYLTGIE